MFFYARAGLGSFRKDKQKNSNGGLSIKPCPAPLLKKGSDYFL